MRLCISLCRVPQWRDSIYNGNNLLKGLSQIQRAPYDFRTRRLAVEFRDRAGPFRILFLRRSWSHIQRSPDDARTIFKFEAARRPSTSRTGADRVLPTFNRAPFDEEVHRSAPGRRPAGDRRRPIDARFYLIRSLGFASSIFVVKLYY